MAATGGLAKIRKANLKRMKPVSGKPRLGPCLGNVRNFIAIGLNYSDHAAEAGMPIPKEPIIFNKAITCLCGPNDDTIIPRDSTKLDYEVELGIVIGKRARYLAKDKAKDVIAGYFIGNDVSERAFQIERSGGQWDKGKGCESFGPIGPWFVAKDEIRDVQNLDMWLDVNDQRRQRGNTRTDRKSTRLNSSHVSESRLPSSALKKTHIFSAVSVDRGTTASHLLLFDAAQM